MEEPLLRLSAYGVSFGRKPVLRDIDLAIPARGITVLLGPSGTGKSTLLRTLAGINDANPSLQVVGRALFQGAPLGQLGAPAIVMQKTRLMMATLRENVINELPERSSLQHYQQRDIATRLLSAAGLEYLTHDLERCVLELTLGEQRLVALIRTIAANPRMILVDEPTSGVSDEDAARILCFLSQQAEQRAIVVVLHNQRQARLLGGTSILLAGGLIVEARPTADFFSTPGTQLGKDFVRTGSCSAPSLVAEGVGGTANDIDEPAPGALSGALFVTDDSTVKKDALKERTDSRAPEKRSARSHAFGPRNFLWLRKGELAGTQRPGLTLDLDLDLSALSRVGISVLVSLESEVDPIDRSALKRHGIQGISLPIPDMGTPSMPDAEQLCQKMAALIAQGEAIALHCKAGIGRTGTMLVAYLIGEGMSALDALEHARKIEPRWVQSREQVQFLEDFQRFVAKLPETMK